MNVGRAVDTTTTIKSEIVLGVYGHIADVINGAGLQLAATAHTSNNGTCVLYVPSQQALLTRRQRVALFKVRWYSDEVMTIYVAHCSIDFTAPPKKSPLEITDDDDMPTFKYNIFDKPERLDELGRWAIGEAKRWLLARHELLG